MDSPTSVLQNEKDITALQTDMKNVKEIVMGKDGLNVSVPLLAQQVENLGNVIGDLTTGVNGLVKFQFEQEGKEEGIQVMRDSKDRLRKRTSWIIGLLVTVVIGMLGGLIVLIVRNGT